MKQALIELLGEERVLTDENSMADYREDRTEIEGADPGFVVFPTTAEEIQAIVKLCNEKKIPITPRVAGTNIGGLSIPSPGGLVMDLTRMNRILECDVDEMVAVIEPGVTQQDLKDYIVKNNLPLATGFSLAPPYTSVLANALLGGLTNRSLKYGSMDDWISGLEMVLPDGRMMRTGAWAAGAKPFAQVPMPGLTGLFTGWQGTTGICTKMAYQLWPSHPYNKRLFILTYSAKATFAAMLRLTRLELLDDIGGLSWPSGKMMMGVQHPNPKVDDTEPKYFLYIDLTAESAEEMKIKEKTVGRVIDALGTTLNERYEKPLDVATLVKVNPAMRPFADFPTDLKFLTEHPGGGLTWIGTYGPLSRATEAAEVCENLMIERGFPPIVVSRPMRGGHFMVLRFIATFDKKSEEDVANVRALNAELLDVLTERGYIMYKTPIWALEKLKSRIDPGMLETMRNIKTLLDPNGIMNPGKWLLD